MSAAAFAKGLLDLEGQLTPILVCNVPLMSAFFLLTLNLLDWVGYPFRSPLLARTPQCWTDLTMPALRWKKLRFVSLLALDFASCFCIIGQLIKQNSWLGNWFDLSIHWCALWSFDYKRLGYLIGPRGELWKCLFMSLNDLDIIWRIK